MQTESPLPTAPCFPFAGQDDATRRAIDAAVAGVENMIRKEVRNAFPRACSSTRDDLTQLVRIHLWSYSLPRFDASKGVKVSTFLHRCIVNRVRSLLPKKSKAVKYRRKLPPPEQLQEAAANDLFSPDQSQDRAVEELAGAFIENPVRYGLTAVQGRIVRAISDAPPLTPMTQIALDLGYANLVAVQGTLRAARDRIRSLI